MMQRVSNNQMLAPACIRLNEWVRKGDLGSRLKCFRELSCPDDTEMAFLVVEALVKISQGRMKLMPYGVLAAGNTKHVDKHTQSNGTLPLFVAVSTKEFQRIPDAPFGLTLAAMYPFVKHDQSKWNSMLSRKGKKNCAHPMVGLWNVNTVHKYSNFLAQFRSVRQELFEIYENEGGLYHGPEPTPSVTIRRSTRGSDSDDIFSDDSDDNEEEDNDFV